MASDLDTWQEERKLDEACCRLVANKVILARLLQEVIQEYHDCSVAELEQKYLEGEPSILSSSVDQDVPDPGRIKGETTVDKSQTEGTIMYDILFSAYSPRRKQDSQVIINVESQNQWDPGYSLMKRAAYYAARMLSRQKGTVFTGSDYGKLQKVYTIWICLELPKKKQNTITVFSMEPEHLVGNAEYDKMNYDMATVIMVCLGDTERKEKDILRLLGILLSPEIQPEHKKRVLEEDYGIPMTVEMEKEAETMCDYGRGLARKYAAKGRAEGLEQGLQQGLEQGLAEGRNKGRNEGIQQERKNNILGMLREKIPMETIARITKVSVEQIRELGKLNGVL
ncbi:PD-(D/E)XK nuclease family transposase [uncultured Acidaminococcus sp.]|nr:PD-(D/E)XK nuclease family transposase [uncultured Acidaminococcus sp.]